MSHPWWVWAGVVGFILTALGLDLFVFHRDAHEVSIREAAVTSAVWVAVGTAFGVGVWATMGGGAAGEYFAGYVVEKALSVENIFVFALILGAFAVPPRLQHRVLFFGVLGALVLRAGFIAAGAQLLERFQWMVFVFGGFLVVTGVRMLRHEPEPMEPTRNPLVRALRRLMPVTDDYEGQRFFVRRAGRLMATPLLAVLLAVEASDVVFAVDSIPAVFAITDDTFIVFTSNAFAILGLRALYFLLAGAMHTLVHLKTGLAGVLAFVGAKMLASEWIHLPVVVTLVVIVAILGAAVYASLRSARRQPASTTIAPDHSHHADHAAAVPGDTVLNRGRPARIDSRRRAR